jgi:hypothetical protein
MTRRSRWWFNTPKNVQILFGQSLFSKVPCCELDVATGFATRLASFKWLGAEPAWFFLEARRPAAK